MSLALRSGSRPLGTEQASSVSPLLSAKLSVRLSGHRAASFWCVQERDNVSDDTRTLCLGCPGAGSRCFEDEADTAALLGGKDVGPLCSQGPRRRHRAVIILGRSMGARTLRFHFPPNTRLFAVSECSRKESGFRGDWVRGRRERRVETRHEVAAPAAAREGEVPPCFISGSVSVPAARRAQRGFCL